MSGSGILGELRELAHERLALEREVTSAMTLESRLIEDLGLDSLRLQALAIEVENHYRICLEPEDEEGIDTVGDLVTVIRGKLSAS